MPFVMPFSLQKTRPGPGAQGHSRVEGEIQARELRQTGKDFKGQADVRLDHHQYTMLEKHMLMCFSSGVNHVLFTITDASAKFKIVEQEKDLFMYDCIVLIF